MMGMNQTREQRLKNLRDIYGCAVEGMTDDELIFHWEQFCLTPIVPDRTFTTYLNDLKKLRDATVASIAC